MARNYAAIPHDYIEELSLLNDAEFGRLIRVLLEYSRDGRVAPLGGREQLLWPRVKLQEDRFQSSYEELTDKRSEAGKRGASARWQSDGKNGKATNAIASNGKNGYTETKTKTETETKSIPPIGGNREDAKASSTRARFSPPAVSEVEAYCRERRNDVDPQRFVDFYASKGWKVGAQPMRDWKAAVRTWEQRRKEERGEHGASGGNPVHNAPIVGDLL
jgi:hypothetical protein|nr:MAG TPA: hypothetical protein [Caudoviricetes sp.]